LLPAALSPTSMVTKPITTLKRADLSVIQKVHNRKRQVDSKKGLIQSKQWRKQDSSMRGFGGRLGAEPTAIGGHLGSEGEAQPPEDGGLRHSPQPPEARGTGGEIPRRWSIFAIFL